MAGFRRRLLAVLLPVTIVAVLGAAAVEWLDQQGARARLAEAQLEPALARALERSLGRLFAVFQEPTGSGYDQLADVFAPSALQTLRPEADYLRGRGLHLGGASTWSLSTSPPDQIAPDRTQVRTVERWLYDERDQADHRQRCFVEDSDQTYVLRVGDPGTTAWVIEELQLGATHRSDCPPGTMSGKRSAPSTIDDCLAGTELHLPMNGKRSHRPPSISVPPGRSTIFS